MTNREYAELGCDILLACAFVVVGSAVGLAVGRSQGVGVGAKGVVEGRYVVYRLADGELYVVERRADEQGADD